MNDDDEVNETGDPGEDLTIHPFIAALDAGDAKQAVIILRQLESLGGAVLEALADMLDDNPAIARIHPYRLTLRRWKIGTPPDPLDQRHSVKAKSRSRAGKVSRLMEERPDLYPKQYLAIRHLSKELGVTEWLLRDDMAAFNRTRKPKKSL